MMYWYGSGMGGWGYALMAVSMLLFWVLIVGAVVALVRYLTAGRADRATPTTQNAPEGILAERFARGEIDEEEYRHQMAVIRHAPTS
jgi:putative membrane protein